MRVQGRFKAGGFNVFYGSYTFIYECFKGVYKNVSRLFKMLFRSVTMEFHWCQRYLKSGASGLQKDVS